MNLRRQPHSTRRTTTERRYRFVGLVLLVNLAIVLVAAAFALIFDVGSFDPEWKIALIAIVIACALLGFGLLYVLFTIEETFKAIRTTMSRDAPPHIVLQSHTTTAQVAPAPMPTIEYGRESRDVEILEGIGSVFSRRLARNGIATLADLRAAPVSQIAAAAQVGDVVAHRWKLMSELMLIREINAQAAELLVLCGVESVEELANESAEALARKARLVNSAHKARIYPADLSVGVVSAWIEAAKALTLPGDLHSDRGRLGRGKASA